MVRTAPTALPGAALRILDLPGRGRTAVWEAPGPAGAPTLLLVHGVTLTSALNWGRIVQTLGRDYRVLLVDQRGHGAGLPGRDFRLEDCADDMAAIAEQLGIEQLIPVGYSMGGLIAQLMWRRHPHLVAGLVLCSSARNVSGGPWEQSASLLLPGLVTAARWMPLTGVMGADLVGAALLDHECAPEQRRWALAEMRRTSLVNALSAIQAVTAFSSHTWIGSVDVPTAVVITGHDRVVPPRRQWKLARALPDATVVRLEGGHDVFLHSPARFGAAVAAACEAVCEELDSSTAESA
ncbi:alpha/beta fold hydrolase [Modestobacter marinus]|uniref:alpha/beta fold hydrolase n=1 Tax=Modestobacter marinus TaxID=477641 RepID=UPI001C95DC24|nr:alpha/beta hydrolase [Modestobacter marinus]